jgi:branched-chain amino acid transport system substrate-binding protein
LPRRIPPRPFFQTASRGGLIALLTILFPLLPACKRQDQTGQLQDRTTIKIGYYGDLSGPTYNFGESAKNGLIMAADEINGLGGIDGRKIDVVIEDDQGSPERAAKLASKLINQDKVIAVVAGGISGASLAAAPRAQALKIPFITTSSTDPAVTRTGDYIFRVCYIDPFQGEVMAKFAANQLKARKAAVMVDFNNPYSRGLSEFFELSFTKLGGQIVSKQSYAQGDPDYKGQLSTIRVAEPDVIYIPGYYGDVGIIAKQARQLGLTQPLLGGDGWDAPELWQLGGDALNNSFITSHYSVGDPAPPIQKFVHDYKQLYGNLDPDSHAALAYDAMHVVAEAIQRAGTTDAVKLREALAQTKNFPGVTGMISMNADRDAVKPAVVLKLQDGRQIYQETIQPESAATSTPAPFPSSSPKKR